MLKTFYDKDRLLKMSTKHMNHTNENSLIRCPQNEETWDEFETSEYAFFPGCLLASEAPDLTIRIYDTLLCEAPDTAIFLQCCGLPAKSEGQEDMFLSNLSKIKSNWMKIGQPTVIIPCNNCIHMFQEHIPDIPVITLNEIFEKFDINESFDCEGFTCSEDSGVDAILQAIEDRNENIINLKQNLLELFWGDF
jgi:Fe-S oxidoreductase